MEKKVSVIIPFYRSVKWLEESVQSVLEQTYKNIEIIVINDGSPEDLTSFLSKYKDSIVYKYQENQGPAVARNFGMSIATGDYIAFEDADDLWCPTKLEKQIAFMEQFGFEWSHTGYYNWWPERDKLKVVNNKNDYDDISKQIIVSCHIATPSVVIRRQVLNNNMNIRFPDNKRIGEDTSFYRCLSLKYPIALIEEPLVKVRMRANNSYSDVLKRFKLRGELFSEDESFPPMIKYIGSVYTYYHRLFGLESNRIKVFFAKVFLVLPFSLERMYVRRIVKNSKKNKKYVLPFNNKR